MFAKSQCAIDDLDDYFSSPEDGPPSWLLMLRAYIDESGHESKDWMFLAGYIGNKEQWMDFVPKWKAALGSQRKSLHMKTLRWKNERTKRLLARLGPIPEQCGLQGCMGGVRFQDYEDLVSGKRDEKLMKGYIACLMPMVTQILRGIPADERLEIVFEQQFEYQPFVNMALSVYTSVLDVSWKMTSDRKPKLARWAFTPKGSSSVMHDPADYLAFALRETWIDKNSKKAKWCSPILTSGSGEGFGAVMSREQIRRVVTSAQTMFLFQEIERRWYRGV